MTCSPRRFPIAAAAALLLVTAPALAAQSAPHVHVTKDPAPHAHHATPLPPVQIPAGALFTEADVRFMQHMIAHHAQAIHMSRMATTRGADPRLLRLAQKIDLSQAGEIALMQDWLRGHGQFAPDTSSWRGMTMAGMLTPEQLADLEAARGAAFDRMYLELMIRHHEGALLMVKTLFETPRAAQDVDVSVLANDVETTQTAEIGLMHAMLHGGS